jgi:hypothetical protein
VRPYFKSDLRSSSQCRSAAHHTNPRRERRHPVTPYVSILRALVPLLAACSCIASAADDYDVQLVARTGQGFLSFDQRVSINDSGWVAFVGQDSSDSLSKVLVNSLGEGVWSSGVNSVVSIFGGDRVFEGAAINNQTPPRIASTERVSGALPSFFVRRWTADLSGTPNGEILASSPSLIGGTTGFLDIDDIASVTFLGLSPGALQLTVFDVDQPGNLTPLQVGVTGGPLLRPQSATNTGDVVLRDMTGNSIVVFKGSPPQGTPIASVSATCSAGSICLKELGSQPGISADGRVVAFYGVEEVNNGNGAILQQPNIFVSVDAGDGTRVIHRVAAGTLADTFADLTLAKDQRVGVSNRGGEPNLDTVLGDPNAELITVVFVAALKDPTPGSTLTFPGIYSVDLLYRDLSDARVLLGRAEPRTIAQKGQLNAVTGTAFNTFTLTDPVAQDKVLKSPLIAFQATMSDGQSAVFRARKNCDVQGVPYFNQADALWGNQLYAFHVATDPVPLIRQVGCTLSASASLLDFYDDFGTPLDPARLNAILKKTSGYSNSSDVRLDALASVARLFGTRGSGFKRDNKNNFDYFPNQECAKDAKNCTPLTTVSPDTAEPPLPQEAGDRILDFYVCNGRPVMLKVMRCTPECGFHYLLATGKTLSPADAKKATYRISDPGRADFKFLTDTAPQNNTTRSYFNRYFGVRAFSGAIPGRSGTHPLQSSPEDLNFNVASPVELVIRDPLGRRLGFDTESRIAFSEIFNSSYVHSSIGTLEGEAGSQLASLQVGIGAPENADGVKVGDGDGVVDGQYSVTLIGTGTGPYTIHIASTDKSGKTSQRVIRGTVTPGSHELFDVVRSSAPGSALTVTKPSLPSVRPGDIDLNGTVDMDDLNEIVRVMNTAADGPNDPRDLDHDGRITATDARKLILLCDKPACAK